MGHAERHVRRAGALIVLLALVLAIAGCSGETGGAGGGGGSQDRSSETAASPRDGTPAPPEEKREDEPAVAPSHCPPDLPACATAEGRIVYVESVDPDGDGDAHFVILDSASITLPGMTAIDVRKGLRPSPLPGPGDLVSAAGPVQTGSYDQEQIHAIEFHVAR
jgi:hypothetical protein